MYPQTDDFFKFQISLLIFQCYSRNAVAGEEGTQYADQGEMESTRHLLREFGEPVSLSLTASERDMIVIHLSNL